MANCDPYQSSLGRANDGFTSADRHKMLDITPKHDAEALPELQKDHSQEKGLEKVLGLSSKRKLPKSDAEYEHESKRSKTTISYGKTMRTLYI